MATLRRLADSIESGERFRIQVKNQRFTIPKEVELSIEHEVSDELETEVALALQEALGAVNPTDAALRLVDEQIPLRLAMNEILRDAYVADCEKSLKRWNRTLESEGLSERLSLPSRRFHRRQGLYAGHSFNPMGELISEGEFAAHEDTWLPTDDDRLYVESLMTGVLEPGKMAHWIAPPRKGINGQTVDFQYVRTDS